MNSKCRRGEGWGRGLPPCEWQGVSPPVLSGGWAQSGGGRRKGGLHPTLGADSRSWPSGHHHSLGVHPEHKPAWPVCTQQTRGLQRSGTAERKREPTRGLVPGLTSPPAHPTPHLPSVARTSSPKLWADLSRAVVGPGHPRAPAHSDASSQLTQNLWTQPWPPRSEFLQRTPIGWEAEARAETHSVKGCLL